MNDINQIFNNFDVDFNLFRLFDISILWSFAEMMATQKCVYWKFIRVIGVKLPMVGFNFEKFVWQCHTRWFQYKLTGRGIAEKAISEKISLKTSSPDWTHRTILSFEIPLGDQGRYPQTMRSVTPPTGPGGAKIFGEKDSPIDNKLTTFLPIPPNQIPRWMVRIKNRTKCAGSLKHRRSQNITKMHLLCLFFLFAWLRQGCAVVVRPGLEQTRAQVGA